MSTDAFKLQGKLLRLCPKSVSKPTLINVLVELHVQVFSSHSLSEHFYRQVTLNIWQIYSPINVKHVFVKQTMPSTASHKYILQDCKNMEIILGTWAGILRFCIVTSFLRTFIWFLMHYWDCTSICWYSDCIKCIWVGGFKLSLWHLNQNPIVRLMYNIFLVHMEYNCVLQVFFRTCNLLCTSFYCFP